jgi:type I restriction enzyme S subunit
MIFYKETEFKDTEIGRIPKDWEVVKIGDVFDLYKGTTPSTKVKNYWNGAIPFVTPTDITQVSNLNERYLKSTEHHITEVGLKSKGLKLVPEGSLLFTSRATIGYLAINKIKVAINQGIISLKSKNATTEVTFFYYLLQKLRDLFENLSGGSTYKEISMSTFSNINLPLPPFDEQQKIAEILSTVDDAIQKTNEIIAKTERLKKGLMHELLTKGIGHKEFKDTEIGRIPKDWEVRTLGEIGELSRGLSYRGHEKFAEEVSGSYLFLTLNSIKEGGGLKENGWSWIRTDRLRERHFVREGDIVIANTDIGMQRGHILGAPAIVYFPSWYRKDRAIYSHHISKLQLKTKLHPQFFFYYLSYVQPMARKYYTGTGVWGLDIDAWSNELSISLPPLAEQQKIAEILSTVDEKLKLERNEKARLERIKQGLMDLLLTGKVRVRL